MGDIISKNKYRLPFDGCWYIEYGGIRKKDSHSYSMINQRYAYDFEIRKNNLPYHDDYKDKFNFYSYMMEIKAPLDGVVVDIVDLFDDTRILEGRPIISDSKDSRGNYILLKHQNNEYSMICHFLKNSFKVNIGDYVKTGDVLGLVGNSGNSNGPHIHFHVQDRFDFDSSIGIKISFCNVLINGKRKKKAYLKKDSYVENN